MSRLGARALMAAFILLAPAAGCRSSEKTVADPNAAVLVGAGDIANCSNLASAEATAKLLDETPGTIFTAGDNAYPAGTPAQFAECYGATWGRHKGRTRPALGNHDYATEDASAYFAYFGAAAGEPGKGYYSYDLGAWHVVVLNSNCAKVPCEAGSPQETWLRADLAAHRNPCTLAIWHHPLFTSGLHGDTLATKPFWQALYDAGAEIVVGGHDHDYERFAPQDADGRLDAERGIRQFVAGTGGRSTRAFATVKPNSEARATGTFGVLKLTLRPGAYEWRFLPAEGKAFTDSGAGSCH